MPPVARRATSRLAKTCYGVTLGICLLSVPAAAYDKIEAGTIDEMVRRAEEASFRGEPDRAERLLEHALQFRPSNPDLFRRLGILYYRESKYRESRRCFESVLTLAVNARTKQFFEAACDQMDEIWHILAKIEEATQLGDPVARDRLAEWHAQAAKSIEHSGRMMMAFTGAHWEAMIRSGKADPRLMRALADGYYDSYDLPRAAYYYQRLSSETRPDGFILRRAADAYAALGQFDAALWFYKRALRYHVVRFLEAADKRARKEEDKEINRILGRIKALPPPSGKLLSWIDQSDDKSALKGLKRRISLNPADAWALSAMGMIYEKKGDERKAGKVYERGALLRREYAPIHYFYGRFLLLKRKEFLKAAGEFELFQYYCAEAVGRMLQTEEKQERIEQLVRATRDIAYIYTEVLQEPMSTVKNIRGALRTFGDYPELYYDLGVSYAKAHRHEAAYQAFEKVIQMTPDSELAKEARKGIDYIRSKPEYGEYTQPY